MIDLARFFVSEDQLRLGVVEISGDDAHHIAKVLRLQAGDVVECVDPQGLVHVVRLEKVGTVVQGQVEETREGLQESPLHLVLFQGLPKGDKMDYVVQKAVELGAAEIVPFTSRYTVVKLGAKQEENRKKRWERIALEAAKQCGRTRLPQVGEVYSFAELVARVGETVSEDHVVLAAYEAERSAGIAQISGTPHAVSVIVGPEGGFAPEEMAQLQQAGASVITLGPRILRTETAGLVALSILGYRWGDLG